MVALDARGVSVGGQYRVLLCSSLFYFRIPEGLWADRMTKVKSAGYNSIDVYFPWNFHELSRDTWDLEGGMRDVRTFLALAARKGLYVVARPGPYICSEWDGGGLPAYLAADGLPIRQNHSGYLDRVREWYRRILPIVAEYQIGERGTVILVQIENELDFFDCDDPRSYLRALRDMALEAGITVPLFVCAGQGDLETAWGGVENVAPGLNLYLESRQPELETAIAPYVEHLGRLGYPLLVPETGRDILLLRRLLASGAKLLGPYNQVGGYDFGFTTAVNNWGHPLSFQTSHYGFDSLVDPFGHVREDAWEHRALGGLIRCLGPALAASRPCRSHGIEVEIDGHPADVPALALGLDGSGGYAMAVSNAGTRAMRARFRRRGEWLPRARPLVVDPGTSTFVFLDLDLAPLGIPGTILFSSAEPFELRGGPNPAAVFQTIGEAEIHYDAGTGPQVVRFPGGRRARATVPTPGSGTLVFRGIPRRELMRVSPAAPRHRKRLPRDRFSVRWSVAAVRQQDLFPKPAEIPQGEPLAMEHHGGLRGYALYEADIASRDMAGVQGILLHEAADVVSLYLDGKHLGTQVPGGTYAYYGLVGRVPRRAGVHTIAIRCETWGHSNFHDPRLPALGMGSLRGIAGATLVRRRDPLPVWEMDPGNRDSSVPYLSAPGGRLTGAVPARFRSRLTVRPAENEGHVLLLLENPECPSLVDVDGRPMGHIDRYHPILSLTPAVSAPRSARITLEPQKWYAGEAVGRAYLLQGSEVRSWRFSRMDVGELVSAAGGPGNGGEPARFPLRVPAGGLTWMHGRLLAGRATACRTLTFRGRGLKASVLFNGHLVGRIFLEASIRPKMAGGRDDVAYLPSCWFRRKANQLDALLEAVGPGPGRLESVVVERPE